MEKEEKTRVVVEIPKSAGKYVDELFEYLESERNRGLHASQAPAEILHVISREEIEQGNINKLLRKFSLALAPDELREL
jgi:hypothetical protein